MCQYELLIGKWTILVLAVGLSSTLLQAPAQQADRTAVQTVLLSITLLCIMGIICSLTTKSLHGIILWFAPINGASDLLFALTGFGR
jgi:hypothetical protein